MMLVKLLYKPFALLLGALSGAIAGALFKKLWALAGGEREAPRPTDRDRSWREVIPAAALEGATFAAVKAAVERGGAEGFHRVTGKWPA
ncbi:DUF4235 domain-containing protein [Streptomyces monticola]|uniref:DUF4235 domain-containing protein n=1 Tax=Streptomyces monticola TaxID=2666263 RepID=A0ABW2JD71_9ACTN